jgi:hypothetical protein
MTSKIAPANFCILSPTVQMGQFHRHLVSRMAVLCLFIGE